MYLRCLPVSQVCKKQNQHHLVVKQHHFLQGATIKMWVFCPQHARYFNFIDEYEEWIYMGHIKCVTSVKNSSIYDCAIWSTIVLLLPFPLLLKFMMLKKLRSGKCFLPLEAFVLFTWVSSSFQCSECTSAFVPVTLLQTLESKFWKRSSGLIALVAYTLIFLTGAIMPFLKLFFFS